MAYGFNDDKSKSNVVTTKNAMEWSTNANSANTFWLYTTFQEFTNVAANSLVTATMRPAEMRFAPVSIVKAVVKVNDAISNVFPMVGFDLVESDNQPWVKVYFRNASGSQISKIKVEVAVLCIKRDLLNG